MGRIFLYVTFAQPLVHLLGCSIITCDRIPWFYALGIFRIDACLEDVEILAVKCTTLAVGAVAQLSAIGFAEACPKIIVLSARIHLAKPEMTLSSDNSFRLGFRWRTCASAYRLVGR